MKNEEHHSKGKEINSGNTQNMNQADIHKTIEEFYEYYAKESLGEKAFFRFRSIQDAILRFIRERTDLGSGPFEMADIGCGAGTQCLVWARAGHNAHGTDINGPLIDLAAQRANADGYKIDFRLGTAANLPWENESMDICVLLSLLEHIRSWEICLDECNRVLRKGGVLFLTTTNRLCPFQQEFNLPLYSWYPDSLKRYFEKLAETSKPEIANYAKYPAVNWFTYGELQAHLSNKNFTCFDRFDIIDSSRKSWIARSIVEVIRYSSYIRWIAHVMTGQTTVLAVKNRISLPVKS